MLSDEDLTRAFGEADPVRGRDLAGPDDPVAARILAQARRRSRRARMRRLMVLPAVALVVAGATAGTYTWVAGDGHPLDSMSLSCRHPSETHDMGPADFDAGNDDPVRVCRDLWRESFNEPAPERLTACVNKGGITVLAGGPEDCTLHHFAVYEGPTQEQRRFAAFHTDLKKQYPRRNCVSYPETRDLINELLTKHGLTGWTLRFSPDFPEDEEGPCAEIVLYDEVKRIVWLTNHAPQEPLWVM